MRHTLVWPAIIILSALAAGLVNFLLPDAVGRPVIVMWFMFVCPGMMLIRFFQLQDPVAEWMLAIALSIAIDGTIAGIQMYSGHWSPSITLAIIMDISILGVIAQIIRSRNILIQR